MAKEERRGSEGFAFCSFFSDVPEIILHTDARHPMDNHKGPGLVTQSQATCPKQHHGDQFKSQAGILMPLAHNRFLSHHKGALQPIGNHCLAKSIMIAGHS